jgi:hypothetical protein
VLRKHQCGVPSSYEELQKKKDGKKVAISWQDSAWALAMVCDIYLVAARIKKEDDYSYSKVSF